MSDLISRKAILKKIEKIRQNVQMMDDTRTASIIMNGMHLCEEAVMNLNDTISRQAAIDTLDVGAEFLRRVLDEADIVGVEREKYEWGLGLIESYISDMKELPSAQPEVNGMKDDTISRQAAIAEFSCCELTQDGGIDANYAIDFLKNMPSAQPEVRTEMSSAGDLVSKQAAVDAIEILFEQSEYDEHDKTWNEAIRSSINAIRHHVPSEQPEPIKINIEDSNKEDWERLKKEWENTPITVLPAQPEIIRCKDCKNSEHWYRDRRRCFLWSENGVSVFDDGFCNYAERREEDDKWDGRQ